MKIYVTYTKTGFQWGQHPAKTTPLDVPIVFESQGAASVEFYSVGSKGIFYRLQNGASGRLSPSDGPTMEVPENGKRSASFSTSSSGDYEMGYVEVLPFK